LKEQCVGYFLAGAFLGVLETFKEVLLCVKSCQDGAKFITDIYLWLCTDFRDLRGLQAVLAVDLRRLGSSHALHVRNKLAYNSDSDVQAGGACETFFSNQRPHMGASSRPIRNYERAGTLTNNSRLF